MLPSDQEYGKCDNYKKLPKIQKQKATKEEEEDDDDYDFQKKLMHRDVERQRRQEMATLYASLRSLLPLDYLKGKRSISDHMNEAVKYIKDVENKIKELSEKRDKLRKMKKMCNINSNDDYLEIRSSSTCTSSDSSVSVSVHCDCFGGIEVVVSSQMMIPLSRVLDMLQKEGLNVVNCILTKVEARSICTIHLEVADSIGIDRTALQTKLADLVVALSSSN